MTKTKIQRNFLTIYDQKIEKDARKKSVFCNFLTEENHKTGLFFHIDKTLSFFHDLGIHLLMQLVSSATISKLDEVIFIICNSCHKINSNVSENCISKLFNVTARIKEKKLKIGFSFKGKSTDNFCLTVSSNLL